MVGGEPKQIRPDRDSLEYEIGRSARETELRETAKDYREDAQNKEKDNKLKRKIPSKEMNHFQGQENRRGGRSQTAAPPGKGSRGKSRTNRGIRRRKRGKIPLEEMPVDRSG